MAGINTREPHHSGLTRTLTRKGGGEEAVEVLRGGLRCEVLVPSGNSGGVYEAGQGP